jgi:hypothetical protein
MSPHTQNHCNPSATFATREEYGAVGSIFLTPTALGVASTLLAAQAAARER